MYSKSFYCELTIYPDFHVDAYAGYIKEQFNNWISDCFTAYTAAFKLSVVQHGRNCYIYDSEIDSKDIAFKKLWQNQFGAYTIKISGEGIIMNGAKSVLPPITIADAMVDKLSFKYKESSDITSPIIIAYGKGIGLPLKYSKNNTDGEEWNSGFCGDDMYCPNFILDISCTNTNFDKTAQVIKEIVYFNSGENADIDIDPYGLNIKITAAYHLFNKNKIRFLESLNKLCELIIQEDNIQMEECNINFISCSSNFALESYLFNEKDGKIVVKNIAL